MDQRIIALYDDFTHRHLDRRLFIEQVTKLVGSSALAMTMMAALRSNYARAATIPADDPRLTTQNVSMPGGSGAVKAYLARPKGDAKLAGVVVIHQNRGLNPHIEDVTRRVALEGYVAVGVDCMSVLGGTPKDEDQAMKDFSKLTAEQATGELVQAVAYLKSRSDVSGKIGTIGFCWGGGMVNRLAEAAGPDLNVGVAFYGIAPPLDQVSKIKAALLLNYAGLDDRVNATKPGYEDALKAAHVAYTAYVYPNVNHAFFDDTTDRYNADAANLVWDRAKSFFAQHLKT
ncbi:MAG TPA: dienelactone hydrolase family protein [Stellaceae bacterium]|nr:dienelactone hydrolase family protein [Stellaceae bacterium]